MSATLGRYLSEGPDQRRLLHAMTTGHARHRHGRELESSSPAIYARRVRAHLQTAPAAIAAVDPKGQPRFLLLDAARNQVAWITPHKEHRSTFFQPRRGVEAYLRAQRAATPPGRLQTIDVAALRAAPSRHAAHTISSAQRSRDTAAAARGR